MTSFHKFSSKDWYRNSETMSDRVDLAKFCNTLRLTGKAVEIGVHLGHYSKDFLSVWQGQEYFCVDPWDYIEGYTEHGIERVDSKSREEHFVQFCSNLSEHWERIRVQRCLSQEAAKIHREKGTQFDFVYIDADHSYERVCEDIDLWYPLCKKHGIFAGHDFFNGKMTGPRQAVYEKLYLDRGYVPTVIAGDAWSWYIAKR